MESQPQNPEFNSTPKNFLSSMHSRERIIVNLVARVQFFVLLGHLFWYGFFPSLTLIHLRWFG